MIATVLNFLLNDTYSWLSDNRMEILECSVAGYLFHKVP